MDGMMRREIVGLREIIRMGKGICHISQKYEEVYITTK